jgi:hypothetical protein
MSDLSYLSMSKHPYPMLDQFMACFGQNYTYWGETVAEIVAAFKQQGSAEHCNALLNEIASISRDHQDDLEVSFAALFGSDFDPSLWGHTATSFLAEVTRLLR